jgi:hypothetical protein
MHSLPHHKQKNMHTCPHPSHPLSLMKLMSYKLNSLVFQVDYFPLLCNSLFITFTQFSLLNLLYTQMRLYTFCDWDQIDIAPAHNHNSCMV